MGTGELIEELRKIAGASNVVTERDVLKDYSHDETEELSFLPEVVVKPRTAQEVSRIMRWCNEHRIPVTPRGAGTGLSGGALPQLGGVLISTERMNSILDIDERNGLEYAKSVPAALAMVDDGDYDVAFIQRPVPVEQVKAVAETEENMPPKSTYFFPKVMTGFVFNPVG